jgi:hypothetical protein
MPDILTSGYYDKWLPASILEQNDFKDLERAIGRAERQIRSRYRENTHLVDRVRLAGWAETGDGTPDVDAMPDDLVEALRDCVARIVEHRLTAPDRHVSLESQGSRSRAYRPRGLPASTFAPLDEYDTRTPI